MEKPQEPKTCSEFYQLMKNKRITVDKQDGILINYEPATNEHKERVLLKCKTLKGDPIFRVCGIKRESIVSQHIDDVTKE